MAHRRPMSPFWDGHFNHDVSAESQSDNESDSSSDLRKYLKGLVTRVKNPNQKDGSNPVINGASDDQRSWLRNVVADAATQLPRFGSNVGLLSSLVDSEVFKGGIINDRSYQMEQIIQLISSLPPGSGVQDQLTTQLIKTLWDNLQHPPLSMLGDEFKYRMADGSNNNILYPHLGKAGSHYTRTVSPQTAKPGILPDPGVIFDSLMLRNDQKVKEHPNKISSMLFYLATIIIHDCFHTDPRDSSKVKTSSYLDLAPLYGSSEEELSRIRTFKDGMLKPDAFCESRILGFPPGVAALLICFNRFHNYIAIELKQINENGRFDVPLDAQDEQGFKRLDNDLFQTARLITCGLYVNIILNDYVRTILNVNRSDTAWTLDPRENLKDYLDANGAPVGIGNQVSVEFNLIYRWHSVISMKDAAWTNDAYARIFPDQEVKNLSEREFVMGMRKWLTQQGQDPAMWNLDFDRYKRTERGTFKDEDLVKLLTEATEDVACAFGARQVPLAMKMVEITGIKQARSWNVATLNEFRKYFQLKPYKRFSEISSNPDVAHALHTLYKHPDYVELYPGLIAEDAKEPKSPGSGLCPGFTISRTILSDAVALVRGDRFYTIDYSPANLTNWGWNQIQSDPEVASGQCIYTLIMRALPNYYRGNSIYAMYPFVIPSENQVILHKLKKDHQYSFSRPSFKPVPASVTSYQGVVGILSDKVTFNVPWGRNISALIGHEYQYMLSGDNEHCQLQKEEVSKAMQLCPVNGMNQVREFYEALTTQLVKIRSQKLRGQWQQLDACADVANPSHAIFVSKLWHIPLKGVNDKLKLGAEVDKVYLGLSLAFAYVFLDGDTAKSFKLHSVAKTACDQLSSLIKIVCEAVKAGNELHLNELYEMGTAGQMLSDWGVTLLRKLLQDKSVDEVVSIIIPTAAAAVGLQAQQFTSILDLYLSSPHRKHWKDIQECAWSDEAADFEKLKKYALEGCRLAPAAYGLLRNVSTRKTIKDGAVDRTFEKGDQLYINFIEAGRDASVFPKPDEVDITRDSSLYIHHGWGPHKCLGRPMVEVAMAAQLRVFAKLKDLRRAPGPQGQVKTGVPLTNPVSSDPMTGPTGITVFMKEDWTDWWPFPTSLNVHHDGFYKDQSEYLVKDAGLPHRATELKEAAQYDQLARENAVPVNDNGLDVDGVDKTRKTNSVTDATSTNGFHGINGHS